MSNSEDDNAETPFVEGYTREHSCEIARDVLRRWIISLAKRQAKIDYEITIGVKKRTRKRILKPPDI